MSVLSKLLDWWYDRETLTLEEAKGRLKGRYQLEPISGERLDDANVKLVEWGLPLYEAVNGTVKILGETWHYVRVLPVGECAVPPPGWCCSRPRGHTGPCAARPVPNQ